MRTTTRAAKVLCVVLISATCTEHQGNGPTEPQFAKRDASMPAGTLQLCKVAGAGIATGVAFDFEIALSGVTRAASVATGDCIEMIVPREGVPWSKGHFQRKTADVVDLIPAGSALRVDAAMLTSDQLVAMLRAGPEVQATSSLLLNLRQQLIAADLNILRGVQASSEVLNAIAGANASVHIDPPTRA